jgi:hypothetical protein
MGISFQYDIGKEWVVNKKVVVFIAPGITVMEVKRGGNCVKTECLNFFVIGNLVHSWFLFNEKYINKFFQTARLFTDI